MTQACIFDLDGTLLDSMSVWAEVDTAFLRQRGIDKPADYTKVVATLSLKEAAAYTIERFNLDESPDALYLEWSCMVEQAYASTIELKPHAYEYLTALKQHGMALAVATSLAPDLYEPALARHGLTQFFDTICSVDEVGRGKRYPDVFLLTAQRLEVEPTKCVVFEDLLEAIISAKQVGMTAYAVYDKASAAAWQKITMIADASIMDFGEAWLLPVDESSAGKPLVGRKPWAPPAGKPHAEQIQPKGNAASRKVPDIAKSTSSQGHVE